MGDDPQFRLHVNNNSEAMSSVWVLLTKHITSKAERSTDFITVHVYDKTHGTRVYYPEKALIQGVYINSPHSLVRFDVPPNSQSLYTLVVSQYERIVNLNFTVNAYSTAQFELVELPLKYPVEKKFSGDWTQHNAGGSTNHDTWITNLRYRFIITTPIHLMIVKLETLKPYSVNVSLTKTDGQLDEVYTSGAYRKHFCYMELKDVQPQTLLLIPSTFLPQQLGNFRLTIGATSPFDVEPV